MKYAANLIVRTFRVLTAQFGLWLLENQRIRLEVKVTFKSHAVFLEVPGNE